MNIKKIKEIVNNSLPEEYMSQAIINIIAQDKNAIPDILEILKEEREQSKELLLDKNVELSRALVVLEMEANTPKLKKASKEQKIFTIGEIKKHYLKWQHKIKCCFNIEGLP